MGNTAGYLELRCPACGWAETCGEERIAAWLRKARKVRAGREPELEIMVEVLTATAGQLVCPACGRAGLAAGPAADDWSEAGLCERCRQPISEERLRAVPGTTLCADCRRREELGRAEPPAQYCPRCGAPMRLELSKSRGLARYVMACTGNPPCRPGR